LPGGDLPEATSKRDAANTPMAKMKVFMASVHAQYPFLTMEQCERLAFTYGTAALLILEDCERAANLGPDFGGGLTAKEVDYLIQYEWARKADDILFRRTRLGMVEGLVDKMALEDYLQRKAV
jgi:glycerol-3-phosphate dehydrogenase